MRKRTTNRLQKILVNKINYFSLAGLFFVLIAGLILAGFPSAVKDTKKENTALHLGGDSYVKKNQMIKEYEAKVGFCFLVLGTFLQIVSLVARKGVLSQPSPITGVAAGIIITALILWQTPRLTYEWWTFPKVKSYFIEKYRASFESIETTLASSNEEVDTSLLDTIGDILDTPRMGGESDKKYLERLRPLFIVGGTSSTSLTDYPAEPGKSSK